MNCRIGIGLRCGSHSILYTLVVIVAIDVIAVFVNEGRVSVNYGASVPSVLDFLET